jgi:hypothetical protein
MGTVLALLGTIVAGIALSTGSPGAFKVAVVLVTLSVLCGGVFGRHRHGHGRRRRVRH